MLVYLDNAAFVTLEAAERRNPGAVASFLAEWRELGCELALTRVHLQEFGQNGSLEGVRSRLDLVARFPNVRFNHRLSEINALLDRELREAFFRYAVLPADAAARFLDARLRISLFPLFDFRQEAHWVEQHRDCCVHPARGFADDVALIENAFRAIDRASELDWPPAEVERVNEHAAGLVGHLTEFRRLVVSIVSQALAGHRAARLNRKAELELFGLADIPALKGRPREDFRHIRTVRWAFRTQTLPGLRSFGFDAHALEAFDWQMDPYRLPGVSVRLALERQRSWSSDPPSANSYHDADHVMFAPYVDVLFADSRTASFIRSELKSARASTIAAGAAASVRFAPDLPGILQTIREKAQVP